MLGNEDMWFTATLVASSKVSRIKGGMSAVMNLFLRQLWQPDGLDMERGGVSIPYGNSTRIQRFVKFGVALSDELALHMFYMCKGASGLKCCCLCTNVFDASTERSSVRSDPWAVLHTCSDFTRFKLHTPASIDAVAKRLREASTTMNKRQFGQLQTVLG